MEVLCRVGTTVPASGNPKFNKYPRCSSPLDAERLTRLWEIVMVQVHGFPFQLWFDHCGCGHVHSMAWSSAWMARAVASTVCCRVNGDRQQKAVYGHSSYCFSISLPLGVTGLHSTLSFIPLGESYLSRLRCSSSKSIPTLFMSTGKQTCPLVCEYSVCR